MDEKKGPTDLKGIAATGAGVGVGAWLGAGVGIAAFGTAISGVVPIALLCGYAAKKIYDRTATGDKKDETDG